ncbi:coiled-coil domain-containing protein 74A-like [Nelusetta ayraudi]|uniref:coiled-coil domain-containing protein 74A-like n=1 Tax=Nelusetta ayraudi TaxID=303726 RepID=UPI003F6E83BA
MLAGRTGGISLPPVRHLPHWTRLSSLGRPRSPPLPAVQLSRAGPSRTEPSRAEPGRAEGQEQRLASLQRSLEFVQQQHRDTLQRLHAEIDHLRRENKELHYKLIMEPRRWPTGGSENSTKHPAQDKGTHAGGVSQKGALQNGVVSQEAAQSGRSFRAGGAWQEEREAGRKRAPVTSLKPLRVHGSPSQQPRPPTLEECEVIIERLYSALSLQSEEMVRVKMLLGDARLSRRTQNHHLHPDPCKPSRTRKPPVKVLQKTFSERLSGPGRPAPFLPALSQTLSSTEVQRQRRSCAVHRGRCK